MSACLAPRRASFFAGVFVCGLMLTLIISHSINHEAQLDAINAEANNILVNLTTPQAHSDTNNAEADNTLIISASIDPEAQLVVTHDTSICVGLTKTPFFDLERVGVGCTEEAPQLSSFDLLQLNEEDLLLRRSALRLKRNETQVSVSTTTALEIERNITMLNDTLKILTTVKDKSHPIESICNKHSYYSWVKLQGFVAGWQKRGQGPETCLRLNKSDTKLFNIGCLMQTTHRHVFFLGDSLVREQYLSFVRHLQYSQNLHQLDATMDVCQPVGNVSSLDTRDFGGPTYCFQDMCVEFKWNTISRNDDQNKTDFDFLDKVKGPVIVVASSSSIHSLRFRSAEDFRSTYRKRTMTFISEIHSYVHDRDDDSKLYWMEPPVVRLELFELHPRKYDYSDFDQLGFLGIARSIELNILAQTTFADVKILPLSAVFERYGSLTCDGLHFGTTAQRSILGCLGFPIVNDILTQVLLSSLCSTSGKPQIYTVC